MCRIASSFSLEKNRSATMPMKNGLTIAAIAIAPYALPICVSVKCSVWPRYVPIVTNHAPQTKYWRNIMTERRVRIAPPPALAGIVVAVISALGS